MYNNMYTMCPLEDLETFDKRVPFLLKYHRINTYKTICQLAQCIGVTKEDLTAYEKGDLVPPVEIFSKIKTELQNN